MVRSVGIVHTVHILGVVFVQRYPRLIRFRRPPLENVVIIGIDLAAGPIRERCTEAWRR